MPEVGREHAQFADGPAVRMALAVATAELREAGCDTPRLDAELLLADAMRTTRTQLHLAPERELTLAESDRFAELLRRRRAREPVAYVLGTRAFRYIELTVDDRVLVPRPESEGLVETGLTLPRGARVVDVGTGSGAIALALKHERPDLRGARRRRQRRRARGRARERAGAGARRDVRAGRPARRRRRRRSTRSSRIRPTSPSATSTRSSRRS